MTKKNDPLEDILRQAQVAQAIGRLRQAFRDAAAADTGLFRPRFQKLSDTFNDTIDAGFAGLKQPGEAARAVVRFRLGMESAAGQLGDLARDAAGDPHAQAMVSALRATLSREGAQLRLALNRPPNPPWIQR